MNGRPLSRDAFDLHYAQTEAGDTTAASPSIERRARREAMAHAIDQELIRQRADALALEYDAAQLALRDERARRGLEGDCLGRMPWWRARVITELRVAAIIRAEGWRPPSDAESALLIDSMIADGALHGEAIILAEIEVSDRTEAQRLCMLARADDADFSSLARAYSCGSTALAGGPLGVLALNSPEGSIGRALAPGHVSDPIESSRARSGATTWRIIRCLDRLPTEQASSSPIAIACMRDHIALSSAASMRAALFRRLRRTAFIDDRVESTMSTAEIRIEMPDVLAEVDGRRITREELLDEVGPRLLFDAARDDRLAWEAEHRLARHLAVHAIVRRERMLIEAVARGELPAAQAETLRRSSPVRSSDSLAWARARAAWAKDLQRSLEAMLLPLPVESEDRPLRDDFEDIAHLHRSLRRRLPARYLVDGEWLDDSAFDLALDHDREATLETDELDRAHYDAGLA